MVEPRISDHEELRELFVDADGVNLHCLEWDPGQLDNQPSSLQEHEDRMPYSDEIPLVMLHGLAATADTWRLVAPYCSRQHRVVAFDQRGHGLSDQPNDGYDFVTSPRTLCTPWRLWALARWRWLGM